MSDVFQLPANYGEIEAGSQYFKPPVGSYEFVCFAASLKAINDKMALTLSCRITKGEFAGREIGPQNFFLNEKAVWKLKGLNLILKLDPTPGNQMSASWYVNRVFIATIEHSDDGKYANFGSFAEATGASQAQQPQAASQAQQSQVFAQQPQGQPQVYQGQPQVYQGQPAPQVYAGQPMQGQPMQGVPVQGVPVQGGITQKRDFPGNA